MQYSSCSVASVFLNVTLIQLPLIGSPFVAGPFRVILFAAPPGATLEFEADKVKYEEDKTAFLNDIQTKETLKASAKAKLIAGEALTEEEANVMIGG